MHDGSIVIYWRYVRGALQIGNGFFSGRIFIVRILLDPLVDEFSVLLGTLLQIATRSVELLLS